MTMKFNQHLSKIRGYPRPQAVEAGQSGEAPAPLINLGLNECSFGCSPKVVAAVGAALPKAFRYPSSFCNELRWKLSRQLKLKPDQLIFGNGAFELLGLFAQALIAPGDEVIIPEPSFGWYAATSTANGGRIVSVPLRENRIDLSAVAAAVTAQTSLIWLCNPHNPMGSVFDKEAFSDFLARVPGEVAIVLDEAYREFAEVDELPDSASLLARHPNLILLRTFSKAYGLAGFRIGYGVAAEEVVAQVLKLKTPPNVNYLAQVAALAALDDAAHTQSVLASYAREKAKYYAFCAERGFRFVPSSANFIQIDIGIEADPVVAQFLQRGVIIRSGSEIKRPTSLRITIGTAEENALVFALLREFAPAAKALEKVG